MKMASSSATAPPGPRVLDDYDNGGSWRRRLAGKMVL